MTTGGAGGDPVFTEGDVGRDYLTSQGVPSEDIVVEKEGRSTVSSTALAGEIMRRMGLKSAIVVSDGYHIYRVKKMLECRGLTVYGSPRPERGARQLGVAMELCEAGYRISVVVVRRAGLTAPASYRRLHVPEKSIVSATMMVGPRLHAVPPEYSTSAVGK